ncbi:MULTISPECIES: peptidylprolyl isomerase [Planktothricoides]|uniref:peptidylprolyl isomerase n=2 Tax=Planktothricoides raciborskii TaxID=132608 RepID=A0AAU8J6K9_9CYAN|nr:MULTISPECIES: peptidylprolyl isomerase [Planktothricoides]KOR36032.1 peptidylprolyl isomerase [Planktothricoides sp. SR001]MBD2545555.1 peptidylprolyl isomerase [Planktothricoides raciborskii FACHB-1370]MBD2583461.1 peptidylprolyl isomerase [Planktothricoides raciborskii FACHB-1261]
MTDLFQVGNRVIQGEQIPMLLKRYQLMPQFLRGIVLDTAIADIPLTEEERIRAIEDLAVQQKLTSPEARQAWLKSQGLTPAEMEDLATHPVRVEKFKQTTWSSKVESYFMERKMFLDQVIYSLIRVQDQGLAYELYFRIQEGEAKFADLAREYSKGPESRTGGLLGPVPVSQPHPRIGKLLSISQPGQLWPPQVLAEWFVIIRLEKFMPAQLDDAMRRRLIDELFETWLKEEVQKVISLQSVQPSATSGS